MSAYGDLSLSSGRFVWRLREAFLTTFTHSVSFNAGAAIPCFGVDEFLKPGIELYIYRRGENRNYSLWFMRKKGTNTAGP